jgi:hypothetical protein
VILAEEEERGLRPIFGRDLSSELDMTHAHVDRINDERATEARQLSQLVVGISDALVDLGMLLIQDVPQLLKSAREVSPVAALVLKRLQEALASCTGPWD